MQADQSPGGAGLQNRIFICCSQKDQEWLERIKAHLRPLERRGALETWDEGQTTPGDPWRERMAAALARARIAVVLLSPDLLASDRIVREQLEVLLAAAQARKVQLAWIVLRPCLYEEAGLPIALAALPPETALSGLSETEQEAALVLLCRQISDQGQAAPPPASVWNRWLLGVSVTIAGGATLIGLMLAILSGPGPVPPNDAGARPIARTADAGSQRGHPGMTARQRIRGDIQLSGQDNAVQDVAVPAGAPPVTVEQAIEGGVIIGGAGNSVQRVRTK